MRNSHFWGFLWWFWDFINCETALPRRETPQEFFILDVPMVAYRFKVLWHLRRRTRLPLLIVFAGQRAHLPFACCLPLAAVRRSCQGFYRADRGAWVRP